MTNHTSGLRTSVVRTLQRHARSYSGYTSGVNNPTSNEEDYAQNAVLAVLEAESKRGAYVDPALAVKIGRDALRMTQRGQLRHDRRRLFLEQGDTAPSDVGLAQTVAVERYTAAATDTRFDPFSEVTRSSVMRNVVPLLTDGERLLLGEIIFGSAQLDERLAALGRRKALPTDYAAVLGTTPKAVRIMRSSIADKIRGALL